MKKLLFGIFVLLVSILGINQIHGEALNEIYVASEEDPGAMH